MPHKEYFFHLQFLSAEVFRKAKTKNLVNLLVDLFFFLERKRWDPKMKVLKYIEFSEIFVGETKTLEIFQLTIYWANKHCFTLWKWLENELRCDFITYKDISNEMVNIMMVCIKRSWESSYTWFGGWA